jgi:hypothetical protein
VELHAPGDLESVLPAGPDAIDTLALTDPLALTVSEAS